MLNFNRYIELKKKNALTLSKVRDFYVVSLKRFDPETGANLAPEVVSFRIIDIEKNRKTLIDAVENIGVLLKDLEKIK